MIDLDRLKATLMTSGLQQKDNALFQVISQLIDAVRQFVISTGTITGSGGGSGGLLNATYLTASDQAALLPNSRELLAGSNVSFDDTIPNERTISVAVSDAGFWIPLSDGDVDEMDLITINGECIMVFVPTP